MLSDIESSVIHLTPSKALQEVIDGISRAMRNYGEIEFCRAPRADAPQTGTQAFFIEGRTDWLTPDRIVKLLKPIEAHCAMPFHVRTRGFVNNVKVHDDVLFFGPTPEETRAYRMEHQLRRAVNSLDLNIQHMLAPDLLQKMDPRDRADSLTGLSFFNGDGQPLFDIKIPEEAMGSDNHHTMVLLACSLAASLNNGRPAQVQGAFERPQDDAEGFFPEQYPDTFPQANRDRPR